MNPTDLTHSAQPAGLQSRLRGFVGDRIQLNSVLIVLCFASVLMLESQSAASYPTYFLAISMLMAYRQWNDVFRVRMLWLIAALLAYLCVTSFWSQPFEWRNVLTIFSRALLVFMFVVAFAECQLRGQLRRWLSRTLALVGFGAVVTAIAVFYSTHPADGRLNGLGQLDTHVIAALVFAVVLIFVLDLVIQERLLRWRSFALVSVVVIGCAIFLSDSRNAWVSAVIGAGVFLLAHRVKDPQRFVAAVVTMGLILAVLLGALLVAPETREIILPRGLSFRPAIWSEVLSDILTSGLWFGQGVNTPKGVMAGGIEFLHPHNLYLSVLYQGGVVALAMFIALIGAVLAVLIRHYHHGDAKLALAILGVALPAYLLDGHEVIDKVGSVWFLFWLPVGIALGLRWQQPVRRGVVRDVR